MLSLTVGEERGQEIEVRMTSIQRKQNWKYEPINEQDEWSQHKTSSKLEREHMSSMQGKIKQALYFICLEYEHTRCPMVNTSVREMK
jgi:hypothetical protein